jgi:16S rRNA C967 or C1407 C5-methylase (RsmB/RsmF family)
VVERLGLTSVAVTRGDAARLPGKADAYDRVLADVPCSGEGTSRKADGRTQGDEPAHRVAVSALQARILARALQLVRPGGIVVYATCTYAPEENEAVLDTVSPEVATIESLDALFAGQCPATRSGATAWGGRVFRPDVSRAARFWPHVDDTGGFFVARLRRLE